MVIFSKNRKKFKRTFYFLMDRVCSGEIYGYKFPVPCFPEKYLNNSYGNWEDPQPAYFRYANVLYTPENWEELDWFDAARFFWKNGEINTLHTYNYLINQSNLAKKPSYEAFLKYLTNQNKSELVI